jgi:hypothetical protein
MFSQVPGREIRPVDRNHPHYPAYHFLLGGFSGVVGGYGYGFGHGGVGIIGLILIVVAVLVLLGRL